MTNVYIAASWKQRDRVRALANQLLALGFQVYDFSDPANRDASPIIPENFEPFDPAIHSYPTYIDRPEWQATVAENRQALDAADIVILLLPAGNDAHSDWAYAVGHGKKTIVCGAPVKGDRSQVHLWADVRMLNEHELIRTFQRARPAGQGHWVTSRRPPMDSLEEQVNRLLREGRSDLEQ